jgi:hypothetical protein
MSSLFEAAATNPKLIAEILATVVIVAKQQSVTVDASSIVAAAFTNPTFTSALQTALAKLAADNQLTFDPPSPASAPTSPVVMLFVAMALIFAPSVFKTTGGTIFDSAGQVSGVEGITSFQ